MSDKSMGQDYANILRQMQAAEIGQGQLNPYKVPTLPTPESLKKRIDETRRLLMLLEDAHRILLQHPDLERLIGTLHKLGSL